MTGPCAWQWGHARVQKQVCPVSIRHLRPPLLYAQDSPTNKLLYAKEIPEYRKIVQRYYQQIHDMMPLSEQEMNAHLAEESRVRRAPEGPGGRRGRCLPGRGCGKLGVCV